MIARSDVRNCRQAFERGACPVATVAPTHTHKDEQLRELIPRSVRICGERTLGYEGTQTSSL